ncbi:hypothetical protein EV138_3825 [Kribbella voronezhensis]|uniref:DUF3800 domain-containing protein n=1 Tax=Kribbella voronezhensis TaxID=2512212 RepID=A0A4R7TDN4_9ACTN|nr:hypothetical protein [Kribbella voronezhensis]TDU90240.1 hypothetical protein EV138_3825 [Kribbella voronezhensis]
MSATTPSDFSLTAWVDESIIVDRTTSQGSYTLAAAVADPTTCDDIRAGLRSLTPSRAERLHWAHESPKLRDAIAEFLTTIDIAAVVVVGSPMVGPKQERARRCCLERLLYELGRCGVTEVWLESRSATPDRRDIKLVDSARRKGLILTGQRVRFGRPKAEPMLWIPDAVAGAVTAAELGEPRWLLVLSEILERHDIEVR